MRAIFVLGLFLLLSALVQAEPDAYAKSYNVTYTASIYGMTPKYENVSTPFAQGDAILIDARMQNKDPTAAIPYYKEAIQTASMSEKAILYETIASLSGDNNYYWSSFLIWKFLGNDFRAEIDWHLLQGTYVPFNYINYELRQPYFATPKGASTITFGVSNFTVTENDILVSQVDRVTRDWLSSQLQDPQEKNLLTVFSEQYDVEGIGWHEGGRIKQYLDAVNLTHIPVTGTLVRKINGTWYAPNENGVFMFDVPVDKVQYPTTRFLRDDLALIIDTHGVNMLVEQAIEENATVVMGCCDHIGKIKAALYLNEKGIKVICNTDKYLPLALGQANETLGSAPFRATDSGILFGAQAIEVNLSEKIIVLNATEEYGLSYYATPTIYFRTLQERTLLPLRVTYVAINNYGQMQTVVDVAYEEGAHVIAARVYDESDYMALSTWLDESADNRIILFHSEAYPYGYLLLRNYAEQVTFDDVMPSLA